MEFKETILEFSKYNDKKVGEMLEKYRIALTVDEARKVEKEILKRPPTLTEAIVWGIEGSEHCSYRSSRKYLKQFTTDGPNVIQGPEEDAGVVELARDEIGKRYGIVIAHESHNHPSQIVPYEGAATGIGGIVRDVFCMGAKVIGTADPLRFGQIDSNKSKWIANGVVSGIAGYGNPIGVPNLAGDAYFNSSYNDNCIINVVALGVLAEEDLIHSKAPKDSVGYDFILIGKPTDNSGFGGASFASFELDETKKEQNKGAVQEPNAFLKRHLFESTYQLFKKLKKKNLLDKVGFKDFGAGGVCCASVEMVEGVGLGAEIDLEKVHISMEGLHPSVILCSETQERFMWIVPPEVTPMVLKHYNEIWDLPNVSEGAMASVVGKVKKGNYVVNFKGQKIVDAPSKDITEGLRYDRKVKEKVKDLSEPKLDEPRNYNEIILELLSQESIASRLPIYEQYDKQVQGNTVIESGQADAGVIIPFLEEEFPESIKKVGMALSVDGNPRYGLIDPYYEGVNAVVEAMRNVAAVGATPQAITDCLNFGNPEKPEQMWEFVQGTEGVAEAAKGIKLKENPKHCVPIISGNVSLYNESKNGSVAPSAIISCIGRVEDYKKAITMEFKETNSSLYLVGKRKDELGGSAYYSLVNKLGKNLPKPDLSEVEKQIWAVTDCIDQELLLSCHDISDGGLVVTLAEMSFGGDGQNKVGLEVDLDKISTGLESWRKLFSETGGFVMEISDKKEREVEKIFKNHGLDIYKIGKTTKKSEFKIKDKNKNLVDLEVDNMSKAWLEGLRDKL